MDQFAVLGADSDETALSAGQIQRWNSNSIPQKLKEKSELQGSVFNLSTYTINTGSSIWLFSWVITVGGKAQLCFFTIVSLLSVASLLWWFMERAALTSNSGYNRDWLLHRLDQEREVSSCVMTHHQYIHLRKLCSAPEHSLRK